MMLMQVQLRYAAAALAIAALFTMGCKRGSGEAPQTTTADAHAAAAPTAAAAATAKAGPGDWFVTTGCTKCHAVSVYNITSETNIGPDLSIAADDVKARFGVPLEEFLASPSGTMAIVLSTQIQLTPEQKQTAIAKLKEAYAEYQRQQAAGRAAGPATSSTR